MSFLPRILDLAIALATLSGLYFGQRRNSRSQRATRVAQLGALLLSSAKSRLAQGGRIDADWLAMQALELAEAASLSLTGSELQAVLRLGAPPPARLSPGSGGDVGDR